MNLNTFSKSYLAGIQSYIVTLSDITSMTSIQKVLIIKSVLGMAALRCEVIDVPVPRHETPLFTPEAEHTAKAEFIT
jgi:hypothetical protein